MYTYIIYLYMGYHVYNIRKCTGFSGFSKRLINPWRKHGNPWLLPQDPEGKPIDLSGELGNPGEGHLVYSVYSLSIPHPFCGNSGCDHLAIWYCWCGSFIQWLWEGSTCDQNWKSMKPPPFGFVWKFGENPHSIHWLSIIFSIKVALWWVYTASFRHAQIILVFH